MLLGLLAALLLATFARAEEGIGLQMMPEFSGHFLDGRAASLPSGLQGAPQLLVFLRDGPDTEDIDRWREVASAFGSETRSVFVVLMGDQRGLARAVSAGRLRRQIADPELRASIVPLFEGGRDLRVKLGLGAGATALLVSETGEILWRSNSPTGSATHNHLGKGATRASGEASRVDQPPVGRQPESIEASREDAASPQADMEAPDAWTAVPPSSETPSPAQIPSVESTTLAGQKLRLPGDLPATGTQLLLFPGAEGSAALIASLEWMRANAQGDWFVLVFKGEAPRFGRAFAIGKLRGEIETTSGRERILPVYIDMADFERHAGLAPTSKLRLIKVDTTGAISEERCVDASC